MISLDIKVVDEELLVRLDQLPKKLHDMVKAKFSEEIEAVEAKVRENLTGRVLNSKSGALLSALTSGVEEQGSLMIGFVAIETANTTVKAYALAHEYGGKGFYEIVPINKRLLRFVGKSGDVVFAPFVFHPPQAERSYLRSALTEMAPAIEEGLNSAIQDALR